MLNTIAEGNSKPWDMTGHYNKTNHWTEDQYVSEDGYNFWRGWATHNYAGASLSCFDCFWPAIKRPILSRQESFQMCWRNRKSLMATKSQPLYSLSFHNTNTSTAMNKAEQTDGSFNHSFIKHNTFLFACCWFPHTLSSTHLQTWIQPLQWVPHPCWTTNHNVALGRKSRPSQSWR
jgi:hypothetical protein